MTMTISTRLAVAAVGVLAFAAHFAAQNREYHKQAAELSSLQEHQQQLQLQPAHQ